jgi:hypothetical protein
LTCLVTALNVQVTDAGFAYKYVNAHGGNPKGRRKTMASKKAPRKRKLDKGRIVPEVRPLRRDVACAGVKS